MKHISYSLFNDSKRISSVQLCVTCTCMCRYSVTGHWCSINYVLVGGDRKPPLVTCCRWKWDIIIILEGSVIILTVITCDMSKLTCNWQETVLLLIMMQHVICQPIDKLRHMADTKSLLIPIPHEQATLLSLWSGHSFLGLIIGGCIEVMTSHIWYGVLYASR